MLLKRTSKPFLKIYKTIKLTFHEENFSNKAQGNMAELLHFIEKKIKKVETFVRCSYGAHNFLCTTIEGEQEA